MRSRLSAASHGGRVNFVRNSRGGVGEYTDKPAAVFPGFHAEAVIEFNGIIFLTHLEALHIVTYDYNSSL